MIPLGCHQLLCLGLVGSNPRSGSEEGRSEPSSRTFLATPASWPGADMLGPLEIFLGVPPCELPTRSDP